MNPGKPGGKLLVQCDFDGTITEDDESFLLLDEFATGDWRHWLDLYRDGKISVGDFNCRAFAMVKTDRQRLVDFVLHTNRIRPGFKNLVAHCAENGIRLVIVSNGLDFYIDAILNQIGLNNISVFAARTVFNPGGLDVRYIGPDGNVLQDGFKESYIRFFLSNQYRVVYAGNGPSDLPAARLASQVFATDQLVKLCREQNISCMPFTNFNEVIKSLEG